MQHQGILLEAAHNRPLAEARKIRTGPRKGLPLARVSAEREAHLLACGWERALSYKVHLLTGLRTEELQSARVGDLDLESEHPTIYLDGSRTKNGEEALVPLREDLAADLGTLLDHRLEHLREQARAAGEAVPVTLDPETSLLSVPSLRTFDADLAFFKRKGKPLIPKAGRGGETASRRSLRRCFSTALYDAGASRPIVSALMRHRSDGTLSEREYLDRRQLDLRQWLDQLPALHLPPPPWLFPSHSENSQSGPMLAPNRDESLVWGKSEGSPDQTRQIAATGGRVASCAPDRPSDVSGAPGLPFAAAAVSCPSQSGCSSVVERNLAKVDVVGSSPISRSTRTPCLHST